MSSPDDPRDPEAAPVETSTRTGDRRTDPRLPSEQPATVRLLNPHASARLSATVMDISRGGLKLRLDRSLMPGTLVQIRLGEKVLLGEIRHCTPVGEEFQAGVRLQDVFETGPAA